MNIDHLIGNGLLRNRILISLIFYSRYVEQDDHLYAHVTVKETVAFNALLRLP